MVSIPCCKTNCSWGRCLRRKAAGVHCTWRQLWSSRSIRRMSQQTTFSRCWTFPTELFLSWKTWLALDLCVWSAWPHQYLLWFYLLTLQFLQITFTLLSLASRLFLPESWMKCFVAFSFEWFKSTCFCFHSLSWRSGSLAVRCPNSFSRYWCFRDLCYGFEGAMIFSKSNWKDLHESTYFRNFFHLPYFVLCKVTLHLCLNKSLINYT